MGVVTYNSQETVLAATAGLNYYAVVDADRFQGVDDRMGRRDYLQRGSAISLVLALPGCTQCDRWCIVAGVCSKVA